MHKIGKLVKKCIKSRHGHTISMYLNQTYSDCCENFMKFNYIIKIPLRFEMDLTGILELSSYGIKPHWLAIWLGNCVGSNVEPPKFCKWDGN